MQSFLGKTKLVLREFLEIGVLVLGAIILIHLILGEGAGPYVSSVAANVANFVNQITAPALIGIAILLAIVYLLQLRSRRAE